MTKLSLNQAAKEAEKITLAGCVILKGNSILLLHRKKRNWYELPGGKIDKGESPEETAKRELKEELCVDASMIRIIKAKDFEEDGFVMRYIWFLAKIKNGQTPKLGEPDKFDHFKFIPIERLNSYSLSPNMKNLVSELKKGYISIL